MAIGDTGIIDNGPANDIRAPLLKEVITKLTEKPVTKIILSREHYDASRKGMAIVYGG